MIIKGIFLLIENKVKRLHLGPKFVPKENRKRSYMDIIQLTEISALYLEREGKFSGAESPWQNISRKKKLAKLKKENKFNNKTYFRLYSFDAIPPRLY